MSNMSGFAHDDWRLFRPKAQSTKATHFGPSNGVDLGHEERRGQLIEALAPARLEDGRFAGRRLAFRSPFGRHLPKG